jgi:hypothetical protein
MYRLQTVVSLKESQSGLSGTGFAQKIKNIGSQHQDKSTQRALPQSSLLKDLRRYLKTTYIKQDE